jgi:DMSO reductase anchor subunit
MATMDTPKPVELIPPQRQALWGWPAVLNFFLGGAGAGAYVVAALAGGLDPSPLLRLCSWLGPALVLGGFAAVATEAGRPLRGPRVLARVRTSWMSRELWIGGAFVLFAAADLLFPLRLHRLQAVAAALLLALAQGFIVRRARGVTAWDVPMMPGLFVLWSLVSGAGLYLTLAAATGQAPRRAVVGALLALLAVGLGGWARYLNWSDAEAFRRAVAPLGRGGAALAIVGGGHLLPALLLALGATLPVLMPAALGLAGLLILGGQLHAKALLILAAGTLRPITLGGLHLQRRLS